MTSPRDELPTVTNSSPHRPQAKSGRRILLAFGTRPEAIKLCPLISALGKASNASKLEPVVCVTGQHREMLDQVLRIFDVQPEFDLAVMQPNQPLADLTARLLTGLTKVIEQVKPALTVVQGDTSTTFCGALSSFYAGVPVAHVEAGLRTFDLRNPFPEESNRQMTRCLATIHFAATEGAARNLLREGVEQASIVVTGNTGIDAVLSIRDRLLGGASSGLNLNVDDGKKLIVVTAHRRESFGPQFEEICRAVAQIAKRPDVRIVWPVHRNPNVLRPVEQMLRGNPNITLMEPLDYLPFVDLMQRAWLLLTDSGGIQEEAPSLGKPVLVLRSTTERPEAVAAGTVKLVGTDPAKIAEETYRLLDDGREYERMARLHNPYGDGHACERISQRISAYFENALT